MNRYRSKPYNMTSYLDNIIITHDIIEMLTYIMTSYLDNINMHDIINRVPGPPPHHAARCRQPAAGGEAKHLDFLTHRPNWVKTLVGDVWGRAHRILICGVECAFPYFPNISRPKNLVSQNWNVESWSRVPAPWEAEPKFRFSRDTDPTGYITIHKSIQYRNLRMHGIHKRTAKGDSTRNWW